MAIRTDITRQEQHYLLDLLDTNARRILEIGSGDGRLTWQYADDVAQVVASDVMLDDLRNGMQSRPTSLNTSVDFLAGSAIRLPFMSSCFDQVIMAWSF